MEEVVAVAADLAAVLVPVDLAAAVLVASLVAVDPAAVVEVINHPHTKITARVEEQLFLAVTDTLTKLVIVGVTTLTDLMLLAIKMTSNALKCLKTSKEDKWL